MDNLEQVSDDELRRRLLQYGLPNLPVTSTTRKILIKKLRLIMDSEKTKLRRETATATRYSSDEESDNGQRSRPTRATLGSVFTSRTPTSSAFVRPSPVASPASRRLTVTPVSVTSSSRPAQRSPVYVSPLLQGSGQESDEDDDEIDDRDANANRSRTAWFNNNNNINKTTTNSFSPTPSFTSSPNNNRAPDEPSSPYLSDFTQRLLNLRGTTVQGETGKKSIRLNIEHFKTHSHIWNGFL